MELHKPTIRVLKILEVLEKNSQKGLSLSEISEQLKLPKGTASPILKTLVKTNYLHFDIDTTRYFIGFKSFELGLSYGSNTDILSMIQVRMKEIVKNVNEICQMGVLTDLDVFYLLKENPDNAIAIKSNVGTKLPAFATGLGKALLSGKPPKEIRQLFSDYQFIKYTDKTISNLDELLKQLEHVKAQGIAHENEESKKEIYCIAVPLVIDDTISAAISVTVPKFRLTQAKKDLIIKELQQKKQIIEKICQIQGYHLNISNGLND